MPEDDNITYTCDDGPMEGQHVTLAPSESHHSYADGGSIHVYSVVGDHLSYCGELARRVS